MEILLIYVLKLFSLDVPLLKIQNDTRILIEIEKSISKISEILIIYLDKNINDAYCS